MEKYYAIGVFMRNPGDYTLRLYTLHLYHTFLRNSSKRTPKNNIWCNTQIWYINCTTIYLGIKYRNK